MGQRGIRVGTAVTLLAFGGALLAALPLQWVWWRTAERASLQLVDALCEQITATVRRAWWDQVEQAEAAHAAAASLLGMETDDEAVSRALRAALTATRVPSSIVHQRRSGEGLAARRDARGAVVVDRIPSSATTGASQDGWRELDRDPTSDGPAVAYGATLPTGGVLLASLALSRFSDLLDSIPVGGTGAAFVVDAKGVRAAPPQRRTARLQAVAQAAVAVVAARSPDAVNIVESRRLLVAGEGHRAAFSPLEFNGWQFVVVVPEAEFLAEIEQMQRRTLLWLVALAAGLALLGALLARRVLTRPVAALTADLQRVERFELEAITHRPGGLREFDQLSGAIARMAKGLADFAKFIPTDLVRTLLADGVRAAPGGETRELTVLFADVQGFTKMSERMGIGVIDVVSRYLDVVTNAVEAEGGTVDKFIGDAVMAFWGAPRADAEQARHACRAALAAIEAVGASGLVDDLGAPLRMRIGIHGGQAVVGNIGSARRLNYTAIGDTVNLASRLEGANKVFGTAILVSEATRAAAGPGFITRQLAEVAVLGRSESVSVHELLGFGEAEPTWVADYAAALHAYRSRAFVPAIARLDAVLAARPGDGPSAWLKAACEELIRQPPPPDWRGVAVLDSK